MKFKTNLNCGNCVAKVTDFLNETVGVDQWSVDLTAPERFLTVAKEIDPEIIRNGIASYGFEAEPVS
jgi:copper chaperone